MYKIISKKEMAQGTSCEFVIEAPKIARKAEPGQFIILRANETGERIPLTIAHADREKGTIAIIFQVVGKTTALLNTFRAGDSLPDVMGPLGKPTHIENLGQVICVGGGTGVAVMYPITRAFKEAGNHVIAIIGARNKELLILENEMKAASHELYVTTDDGSYGHHGFVTDVLKQILDRDKKTNEVIGIGPVPMMKAVANVTKPYG
ncbi:MAG: sulfide/dihydroorotate dehydrogenase-like FAD/NAD-binding protein, partial [Candidatus Omnitrophica bacterium]|nr:sulfide/dihydroorotate dehydrogenase-like FAD/NAD-binding protein [Candidatus Omnitrophota bacterium]